VSPYNVIFVVTDSRFIHGRHKIIYRRRRINPIASYRFGLTNPNSDVDMEEGGILTELSLPIVLCSISVMHNRKSSFFRLVYWIWVSSYWA